VLAPPAVAEPAPPGSGASLRRGTRGWRTFATAQVAGAIVEAEVAGTRHRLVADRGGYIDATLPVTLTPGWHEVRLSAPGVRTVTVPVQVVGPGTTWGIVSDIDDTVMVTRVPRPFVAAWNVFVRRDDAREAVPGMARLYRDLLAEHPDAPVVYVSTGAWNAAPAIGRFLRRYGYPRGALLLTDWGPTNTGWFRSGPEHKRTCVRRLVVDLPHVRWVLIGDDGQRDPQIYAELVRERPDAVRAVLIRELTVPEHVLAHGTPVPRPGVERAEQTQVDETGTVPVLQGADGTALGRAWRLHGPDPAAP